ncbi:hypothetical protein C8Q74DRAFT_1222301 [Fomes fomentarius]|nr:hypothetical protein C8Q74DRAFT_1222301 [Fomes fomentarius]
MQLILAIITTLVRTAPGHVLMVTATRGRSVKRWIQASTIYPTVHSSISFTDVYDSHIDENWYNDASYAALREVTRPNGCERRQRLRRRVGSVLLDAEQSSSTGSVLLIHRNHHSKD